MRPVSSWSLNTSASFSDGLQLSPRSSRSALVTTLSHLRSYSFPRCYWRHLRPSFYWRKLRAGQISEIITLMGFLNLILTLGGFALIVFRINRSTRRIIMSNKSDLDALQVALVAALQGLSDRIGALTPENLEAEKAAIQGDIDAINALAQPAAKP